MYDATNEILHKSRGRASSRSSLSKLQIAGSAGAQDTPQASPDERNSRGQSHQKHSWRGASWDSDRAGLGRTASPQRQQTKKQRSRSTSSSRTPQIRRSGVHISYLPRELVQQAGRDRDFAEGSQFNSTSPDAVKPNSDHMSNLPPDILYRPTENQLIRDADTFNEFRSRSTLRGLLVGWAARTFEARTQRQSLEALGIHRDATTLTRQACDLWRAALSHRRKIAQAEQFYDHLHTRAAKAYELYLLTKSLTHWKEIALDEVLRTSVARRHILRTKYFHAWHEITAVNEMKAQRLGLGRPYNLLKRKYIRVLSDQHRAITIYHENLTRFFYWRWFWNFCDRRAPGWGDARLKQRTLLAWIRTSRSNRERDDEADSRFNQTTQQNWIPTLLTRVRTVQEHQQNADVFKRQSLLRTCVHKWRLETQLAPIANRVGRMVDWRVARSTSSVWMLRTRMGKRAGAVNDLRIKRNVWTTWNDRLRIQTLTSRIDERLVVQAVYKLVLAERSVLMRRLLERRIKRITFHRLLETYRTQTKRSIAVEQQLASRRSRGLLGSSFECWILQLHLQRQREIAALDFHAPKIKQDSLESWRGRFHHVQKIETWAEDAEFYFIVKRSIRSWQAAALASGKKQRQDAYSKVRKLVKMNLARKALTRWHERAHAIIQAGDSARTRYRERLSRSGGDVFDRWRLLTSTTIQALEDADAQYRREKLSQCLRSWLAAAESVRDINDKASRFSEIHVSEVTATQLRKLSLRIFEVRRRAQDADAIQDRNQRKHTRNMFRHWLVKARISRGIVEATESLEADAESADVVGDVTHEAEDWAALDQDLNETEWILPLVERQGTSTPQPGYMNTPSKRAVRAKALANLSLTTPAMAWRTPLANKLRSARSSVQQQSTMPPSTVGRSLLRTTRGVEDEEDLRSPSRRASGDDF